MDYVIQPPPPGTLAVTGSDARFPVSQIYCVGRNYADHAVEMGGDPSRELPFFFMKPAFALLEDQSTGVQRLRDDLASGEWADKNRAILDSSSLDVGYRLVSARVRRA